MTPKKNSNFISLTDQLNYIRPNLFLPYFLLGQTIRSVISTDPKYFTKLFFLDKALWSKFFLLYRMDLPNKLPFVVDGIQFTFGGGSWVIQYNLGTMLLDDRTSVYTAISYENLNLPSIGSIFSSCIWLERELSDFTNITFEGLLDTRRLLLDYFEEKKYWQTHVSNDKNFNEIIYDVCLTY